MRNASLPPRDVPGTRKNAAMAPPKDGAGFIEPGKLALRCRDGHGRSGRIIGADRYHRARNAKGKTRSETMQFSVNPSWLPIVCMKATPVPDRAVA